ncbi:MAG: flagellar hook-length control protein FliK [Rhizobiaceae bacterium]|nr:flagellar hook-length control protein FliK [Rhizobiaceae bacterium]
MTEAVKQAGVLALLSPKAAAAKGPGNGTVPAFGDMLRAAGAGKGKKDDGLGMPEGVKTRWQKPQTTDGEVAAPVAVTETTTEARKPAPTRETRETHVTREAGVRIVIGRDDRAADARKIADADDAEPAASESDEDDTQVQVPPAASDAIIQFTAALDMLRRGGTQSEAPTPARSNTPVARSDSAPGESADMADAPATSQAAPATSSAPDADPLRTATPVDAPDVPAQRAAPAPAASSARPDDAPMARVDAGQATAPARSAAAPAAPVAEAARIMQAASVAQSGPAAAMPGPVTVQAAAVIQAAAIAQAVPTAPGASATKPTDIVDSGGEPRATIPSDAEPAVRPGDAAAPKTSAAISPASRTAGDQPAADPRQATQPAPVNREMVAASQPDTGSDTTSRPAQAAAPEARRIDAAQARSAPTGVDTQAASAPTPPPSQNASAIVAAISGDAALRPRVETLAQTLIRMSSANGGAVQTLKVQLNPVELGMVTAQMRFEGEQLSVELQVDNPEAYQRLAVDKETIARSLRALGFEVDQVSVQQPQLTANAATRADIGGGSGGGFNRDNSNFQSWNSSGDNGRAGNQGSGRERDNGGNRRETSAPAGPGNTGSGLYI